MNRRRFLKWMGFGGASAAAVSVPYAAGNYFGEEHIRGNYRSSIVAGERHGHANVWWSVDTDSKVLALTFDDGPTEQFTDAVLDVLDSYGVPASFFLIGELVHRRPDDVVRMIEGGHEVANHTFDHYSAGLQSPDDVRRTMELGADAVARLLGGRPRWFRPVKGHLTGAVLSSAAELGHDIALWSLSRGPTGIIGPTDVDAIREHMVEAIHPGAVVILHDGIGRSAFERSGPDRSLVRQRAAEVLALPGVIERYLEEGYTFATISALIDQYGQ